MITFEESLLDIAREAQAKKQCLDKFSSEDLFLNNPSDPPVSVPKFAARLLKPHHSMGVIFLYHAVVEKKTGAILNQDEGMNWYIQVAAFLNALYHSVAYCPNEKTIILCSPNNLIKWHYYITRFGELNAEIVKPENMQNVMTDESVNVVLISFSYGSLLNQLKDQFSYFIVEHIDLVIRKQAVNRLQAKFKIGLTHRNFILNIDQRLQWSILNWANKGCVGKYKRFAEKDQESFIDLRDPYIEWWQRLTWKFCTSFQKETPEEMENLLGTWAQEYDLEEAPIERPSRAPKRQNKSNQKASKRKSNVENVQDDTQTTSGKQPKLNNFESAVVQNLHKSPEKQSPSTSKNRSPKKSPIGLKNFKKGKVDRVQYLSIFDSPDFEEIREDGSSKEIEVKCVESFDESVFGTAASKQKKERGNNRRSGGRKTETNATDNEERCSQDIEVTYLSHISESGQSSCKNNTVVISPKKGKSPLSRKSQERLKYLKIFDSPEVIPSSQGDNDTDNKGDSVEGDDETENEGNNFEDIEYIIPSSQGDENEEVVTINDNLETSTNKIDNEMDNIGENSKTDDLKSSSNRNTKFEAKHDYNILQRIIGMPNSEDKRDSVLKLLEHSKQEVATSKHALINKSKPISSDRLKSNSTIKESESDNDVFAMFNEKSINTPDVKSKDGRGDFSIIRELINGETEKEKEVSSDDKMIESPGIFLPPVRDYDILRNIISQEKNSSKIETNKSKTNVNSDSYDCDSNSRNLSSDEDRRADFLSSLFG